MKTKQKKNKYQLPEYTPWIDRLSSLEERTNGLFKLIQAVRKFQQTWDMYAFGEFEELEKKVSSPWCECTKPNHWDGFNTWDRGFCYICHKPLNPIKPIQPKEDDKELREKLKEVLKKELPYIVWNNEAFYTNIADKIIALIKEYTRSLNWLGKTGEIVRCNSLPRKCSLQQKRPSMPNLPSE